MEAQVVIFLAGKVILIGCGASAGQLSQDAAKAIKSCDVVLFDRLVDERVLRFCRGEKIFVGKKPGQSAKQGEINKLLLKLAKQGKTVGRLKAGDAFLFSRGCEEKIFLEKNGVPVEVISGQSALNALSCAGIPLTCRGVSSSASILAGVEERGRRPKSFKGLDADTVVFFMPLHNLENIVAAVLKKRGAKTPCVFVENAGRKAERKIFCTLGNAVFCAKEAGVSSPSLFVAGNCVSLAAPALAGKKILSFREKNAHSKVAGFFRKRGAVSLNVPVFSIKRRKIASVPKADVYAFTGPNAVKSVFSQFPASALKGPFVAIGSVTADELQKFGKKARVPKVESVGGMEQLLSKLAKKVGKEKIVVFCSPRTRLKGFGKIYAYDAVFSCEKGELLSAMAQADTVFFTSPEILRFVLAKAGKKILEGKGIWTVGPSTAREAKEKGLRVDACLPFPDAVKSFDGFFKNNAG